MTLIHAIILGIVEGFTEFLPISSTAHLILVSDILKIDQSAFVKSFEIAIQSGAILAVIVMYWRRFTDMEINKRLLAAFIPTAVIGFVLYKIIKQYLLGNTTVVLYSLAIGGILLIVFEKYFHSSDDAGKLSIKDLNYKKAAYIGLAQSLAVIPGVSRSAATIVGGMLAGMSRAAIVEFSFLLAVPTILAASAYDAMKNISSFSDANILPLVVGFSVSFLTAIFGIKFLLAYIRNNSFVKFGIYRIVLVIVFIALFIY